MKGVTDPLGQAFTLDDQCRFEFGENHLSCKSVRYLFRINFELFLFVCAKLKKSRDLYKAISHSMLQKHM